MPENWGPIFGLHGFKEKLGNLSWLGDPDLADKGWFDTGIPATVAPAEELDKATKMLNVAKNLLSESDWSVLPDVPMNKGKKAEWLEYRKSLREIKLQPGFPDDIKWPTKP